MKTLLVFLGLFLASSGGVWWGFITSDNSVLAYSLMAAILAFFCVAKAAGKYFKKL